MIGRFSHDADLGLSPTTIDAALYRANRELR